MERYGGEFVTYDDAPDSLQGVAPCSARMITFKFPSQDMAWHAAPQYQPLSEHRLSGTQLEFLTIVRDMPQRA